MKAVILAGGLGTRISEETQFRPKPMIEIGGRPIIWHVMKIYAAAGVTDFVVCCGYRGYVLKEYFVNYALHSSDMTVDLRRGEVEVHQCTAEPWRVTLVDTGETTMTGGRLLRVADHLPVDEPFCFTYGDAVADIDVRSVIAHHRRSGVAATMTAVQPPGRFGSVSFDDGGRVADFREKPAGDGGWINGGFFVLDRRALDVIEGDDTVWEQGPLEKLTASGELGAYRHPGFWHPMDTLRDKLRLEELWASGCPPWKRW